MIVFMLFFLTGCATIAHKNVETKYSGFGVNVDYKSTVMIEAEDIPAFIRAVDKLEKLLKGE